MNAIDEPIKCGEDGGKMKKCQNKFVLLLALCLRYASLSISYLYLQIKIRM